MRGTSRVLPPAHFRMGRNRGEEAAPTRAIAMTSLTLRLADVTAFHHFLEPEPRQPEQLGGTGLVPRRLVERGAYELRLELVDPRADVQLAHTTRRRRLALDAR